MSKFNWPIIGHSAAQKYLQTVLERQSFNHAYLFSGPEHVGKATVAEYFAASLFCRADNLRPCGHCPACRQLASAGYPGLIKIKPEENKQNISIEQIRWLKNELQHTSLYEGYRLVIIYSAELMSLSAANSLLKLLEEPSAKIIFILLTSRPSFLPATIVSRTQVIKFLPVPLNTLRAALTQHGLESAKAELLARLSFGLPGKIMPLLSSPDSHGIENFLVSFKQSLNFAADSLVERFKAVDNLAAQSKAVGTLKDAQDFLLSLAVVLRDILLLKYGCAQRLSCPHLQNSLWHLAGQYQASQLVDLLYRIQQGYNLISKNANLKLVLESISLQLAD
jgi:DNA polymerase-3 subunit delta'